jgi:hypothetical protein
MCGDGTCSTSCTGCCGPAPAPPERTNAAGQPAIDYRSGLAHADVLDRMLTALPGVLPGLTGVTPDDPAAAVLDAWAAVADVVSFYQERIANEGYLRTATERRSVLELARAIGYELRPGVSAAALLSVQMQQATGAAATAVTAPPTAVMPRGTQVRSLPGQGQLPQTFETSADLVPDLARNELHLVQARTQRLGPEAGRHHICCYLAGTSTGLRTGDTLLITEGPAKDLPATYDVVLVSSVTVVAAIAPDLPSCTMVSWDPPLTHDYAAPEVSVFAVRASLFGFNAPDFRTLPADTRLLYHKDPNAGEWPHFEILEPVDLDAAYPAVAAPSVALFQQYALRRLYPVEDAQPVNRADFAISARVTRLSLGGTPDLSGFKRRTTVVNSGIRQLPLAGQPIGGTIGGPESDPAVDLLAPALLADGQRVLVTGTAGGLPVAEPATVLRTAPGARSGTVRATLEQPLTTTLDRGSVRVLANVVEATHGESVPDEVLGSGDGTVPNQRFALARRWLTQLPVPGAPGGVQAALEVLVDDVLWTQTGSLYPAGPNDRVYVVRVSDDGTATVLFGDGERGARLPTGPENVHARYRVGVGPDGRVPAHALTLLPQRPPGVASVDNPSPAGGDSAPEKLDDARRNAPLTVLTLDRVVSLPDYETFAAAFGGIAKARAARIQGRTGPFVHLTLAGPDGSKVQDLTIEHLLAGLDAVRDHAVPVRAVTFDSTPFRLRIEVLAEPDRVATQVQAAVRAALTAAFAIGRRSFAEPVTVAEVLTLAQQVDGVRASRVTDLRLVDGPDDPRVVPVLPAQDARLAPPPDDPGKVIPAELLLLGPGQPIVEGMRP